jgi:hypothetical protein
MGKSGDPNQTDPPKAKHGQKNAQPAQKNADVPPGNPMGLDGPAPRNTRARGHLHTNTSMPAHAPAENDLLPSSAVTRSRKRGRKDETVVQGPDDDSMQKRPKKDDNDVPEPPAKGKTSRKQKQSANATPREPLPDRPGRNVHPAGQRATRRTPQEVAAEHEAKKRAIEEKIREGEKAKELLAQLNVDEDLRDEEMLTKNPQRLSAAIRKRGRQYLEDDEDGEEFDFAAIEEEPSSDDVGEEPVKAKAVSDQSLCTHVTC